MPELGMGMHQRAEQRMEMRQELVQQVVMLAPGDGVAGFRTDEEKQQVSQYEILKQLSNILTNGEYLDNDHFGLEINRAIFGHPLEARLGNFGRDIENIVRFYEGNEDFAKKTILFLGTQKEERDRKNIPGQIASAWHKLSSSDYLAGEKTDRKIPNLIGHLHEKNADTASGLDLISQAVHINQNELIVTSLNKIEEYANQDTRVIPFAHTVLSNVFLAIKQRNEQLTEKEAKAVYSRIVDSLFMLDRDLRIKDSVDNISDAIKKYGIANLLSQTKIPLPLQISLEKIIENEDTKRKIIEICSDHDFVQGRELQRKIYRGLASLEDLNNQEKIIEHISQNVNESRGLGRILGAVSLVAHEPEFIYPFDLQGEDAVLRNLKLQLTDKSIKRLGLNDTILEKYLEKLEADERFEGIGKIVTKLAGYNHYQNPQQIGLLKEIITAELEGKFLDWKYSHDKSKTQLAVLEDKIESWKKNSKVTRLVGELNALKTHVESIKNVAPKLDETYREQYLDDMTANTLKEKLNENEELLRSENLSKNERKELGYKTSLIREQLQYRELIEGIQELTLDNYQQTLDLSEKIARKRSKNPLYHNAVWIRETLDQPVYRDARRISIIETDDLEDLLRMGERPVPHCQDWRNDWTLNESLLSFVADSNKKLYHIANGNDKPFGMSLIRLVEWEDPTLLIENIYSSEWSTDHGIALVGSLADKAAAISESTGKPVRLAAPHRSGHQAHDTNIQVKEAFERFSEQYKVYINEGTIDMNLPESKNTYEYVDCGPGKIKSGSDISIDVSYITFGEE